MSTAQTSAASPDAHGSQPLQVRGRGVRVWLFQGLACAFPILVLAFVECVLSWNGYGHEITPLQSFVDEQGRHLWFLNPSVELRYTATELRGPEPRAFALPKPTGTFRVVVLGESTVQGFPYSSELAFPQHLKLLLSRQLPDQEIEVLNAGIVGISSVIVADLFERVLRCQPDVVVVYTGHNEFQGIGGVVSKVRMQPLTSFVRQFRLGQFLTQASAPPGQSDALMTELAVDFDVAWESPTLREAEARYRQSLQRIAAESHRVGLDVILCGVACNLRDQSPFAAVRRVGLTESQLRQLTSHMGDIDQKMLAGNHSAALAQISAIDQEFPNQAIVAYRRAQSLEALHDERAAQEF